ncbi:MAG: hypothetical protein ACPGOV_16035 [Magnetovibrionaceae bacterium]
MKHDPSLEQISEIDQRERARHLIAPSHETIGLPEAATADGSRQKAFGIWVFPEPATGAARVQPAQAPDKPVEGRLPSLWRFGEGLVRTRR